jgi:hypothetical protein
MDDAQAGCSGRLADGTSRLLGRERPADFGPMGFHRAAAALTLLVLLATSAHAGDLHGPHVTLYPGQGVRTNLVQVP